MNMESIYSKTKGTEMAGLVNRIMQAEVNGTMMYEALAMLADDQGIPEAADAFRKAAREEAVHAGFYALMNGKYPQDFWRLVKAVQKAEANGEAQVNAIAAQFRAAGLEDAAQTAEIFAKQEGGHGVAPAQILEKYAPKIDEATHMLIYVCPVCGYEYAGDITQEPDDYVCPLCGVPKAKFTKKA